MYAFSAVGRQTFSHSTFAYVQWNVLVGHFQYLAVKLGSETCTCAGAIVATAEHITFLRNTELF